MSEAAAPYDHGPQLVGNILTGADDFVKEFVSRETGYPIGDKAHAIGIVLHDPQRLVGGVVYSSLQLNHAGTPNSCEMSVALLDRRGCTRAVLRAMFRYPFVQLGCLYVWGGVRRKNRVAREFDERLGFRLKCIIEDADPQGGDMALYHMRRKDCRWLAR